MPPQSHLASLQIHRRQATDLGAKRANAGQLGKSPSSSCEQNRQSCLSVRPSLGPILSKPVRKQKCLEE